MWGALAYADVELPAPLTWGVIKGYLLRNLRWWLKQPFLAGDGTVTIGFGYQNGSITENYNSPGSVYWCCKAFLPLALPNDHPFWTSSEESFPSALPETIALTHPLHIVSRAGGHTFLLSSGQMCAYPLRHSAAKYGKFSYSAPFGFSMPTGICDLDELAGDGALALADLDDLDGGDQPNYRVRRVVRDAELLTFDGVPILHSFWDPWKDTEVETWLIPPAKGSLWHVRVHRVRVGPSRRLRAAEGAFAIHGQGADFRALPASDPTTGDGAIAGPGLSLAASRAGAVGIVDLLPRLEKSDTSTPQRAGLALRADANTNVMVPRTVLPTLVGEIAPGTEIWYATAVFGVPSKANEAGPQQGWVDQWKTLPQVPEHILKLINAKTQ